MVIKGSLFEEILSFQNSDNLLAILIDPDKFEISETNNFLNKIPDETTHIFVGGSTVALGRTCEVVKILKTLSEFPVILFPGNQSQVSSMADGILFLSLISGRNPEYLIEQQVQSVKRLRNTQIEIIPTGYILVDGATESTVARISQTRPMPQSNVQAIVDTALAGQFSGKYLIYLEAGSGAKTPVSTEIIKAVKNELSIPLIVGGGIRSYKQLKMTYDAGADLVVIGTAFENDSYQY